VRSSAHGDKDLVERSVEFRAERQRTAWTGEVRQFLFAAVEDQAVHVLRREEDLLFGRVELSGDGARRLVRVGQKHERHV